MQKKELLGTSCTPESASCELILVQWVQRHTAQETFAEAGPRSTGCAQQAFLRFFVYKEPDILPNWKDNYLEESNPPRSNVRRGYSTHDESSDRDEIGFPKRSPPHNKQQLDSFPSLAKTQLNSCAKEDRDDNPDEESGPPRCDVRRGCSTQDERCL